MHRRAAGWVQPSTGGYAVSGNELPIPRGMQAKGISHVVLWVLPASELELASVFPQLL